MEKSESNGSVNKLNGKNTTVQATPEEKETFLPSVEIKDGGDKKQESEADGGAPKDRFHLVYFIMMIHGIGTLMPWNMFITANAYFVYYKLGGEGADDTYRKYFLSALGFTSQIPNVALNFVNLFMQCGGGGNLAVRIISTIIIVVLMFVVTVILAMIDSSGWPAAFFWITMVTVVIINMANGMYQNSIYGTAACLPMKYTNAVVLGSNTSGTITAILNIISIAVAPDPRTAAIYYFMAAIFVLILAFDVYLILPLSSFYRYHRDKAIQSSGSAEADYVHVTPPFRQIFMKCYKQHLGVWFVFFVTLTCFPAIQANIHRSSDRFPLSDKYYSPITCFLFFNFFAMMGNLATEFVKQPGPKWVWIPVVLRGLFIPFFMFCNFNPESRALPILFPNDYINALGCILMAFTSGYFSSLCMMYAPRCVEDKHKGTAGMMAAFFLIFGIFSGVCFSFVVIAFIENVGNYVYVGPPVNGTESYFNATSPNPLSVFEVTLGS